MKRAARLLRALFLPRGKFAISFLIFLVLVPMFVPLLALGQQSPSYTSQMPQQYAPNVPRDENSAMQVRLINVLSAIGCQLTGINPAYPKRPCVGINTLTDKISFIPREQQDLDRGGAIGFVGSMMVAMYAAPVASTNDYLAYLGDNFGIVKKAHAQGVGFSALTPVLPLWTASRNIAYFFYVLAFVVVGILIMVRVRIDPRTVMTIQNQIPKIVIGIILITFSYAIAGFLIDFMYTSMYVLTNVVTSVKVPKPNNTGFYDYSKLGPEMTSATNPITAASRMGGDSEFAEYIPGQTINGIADLVEGPAGEVGESLGHIFEGGYGHWVYSIILGVVGGLAGKSIAQSAGGGGKLMTALGVGLSVVSLFAPEIGIPATMLLPVLAATPSIANGIRAQRAGNKGAAIGNAALAIGSYLAADKLVDTAANDGKNLQEAIFSIIAFIIIAVAMLTSLVRIWFTLMKSYLLILIIIIMSPFYIVFGLLPGSNFSFSTWLRALAANLAAFPTVIILLLVGKIVMDGLGATQSQGLFVPPLLGNASVSGTIQSVVGLTFILLVPNAIDFTKSLFQSKSSPYGATAAAAGAAGFGYAVGLVRNPLNIMHQSEEARWDVDTGGYQKTGVFRAAMRRALGG